jgi:RNA 2',3'-cyclic 3'-phosphodiesterase
MRAFIGIDLDTDVRCELATLCERVQAASSAWRSEKWVPAGNLHLTLRFLGNIEPELLQEIRLGLDSALAAHKGFALECRIPVEPIPGARRARMLWTRYDDTDGRCAQLANSVDDVLATVGIPPEERPFVPHVTLVRARRPRKFPHSQEFSGSMLSPMSVHQVTLFSSVLTRTGPAYRRMSHVEFESR